MPIYEYSCQKCGESIEVIQKFSDPDPVKHKGCGGKLNRQMSVPSVQIRGSGWQSEGRMHPSLAQQNENEARSKEKRKKSPK
jgi:putative FmdB family regulatory protein